jgi:hypothetical protein
MSKVEECKKCFQLSCANEKTTYCKKHQKKQKRIQTHGFCITVNNWDDEDYSNLKTFYENDTNCQYLIIGKEIAPRTGTRHLQAYIYYKKKVDFKKVIEWFSPWHVEPQKASKNVAAYVYCMEDGDYEEFGQKPRQGHRTDLEDIKHQLLKGRPMKDISKDHFSQWCQYRRAFDEFLKIHKSKYQTTIKCYDKTKLIQQFKIISKVKDRFVYPDIFNWLDVLELKEKGEYETIFIPNIPLLIEGNEDAIDEFIF